MANLYLDLPAPAANAAGAAIDVTTLGATKTIVVEGNGTIFEPFVVIEVSNDDANLIWTPLVQFRGAGEKTVNVACRFMRAVTTNYTQGGAPTVSVGSTDIGTQAAELVAPAGNGAGAGVDISALGDFTTVQVSGIYKGACNLEVSNDGETSWAQVAGMSFISNGGISKIISAVIVGEFLRVVRTGIQAGEASPGLPIVDVCGSEAAGSGGGGITGAGTYEHLARWTPDGSTLGDSVLVEPDGGTTLTGTLTEEVNVAVSGDDLGVSYDARLLLIHDDDDNVPSAHLTATGSDPLAEVKAESQDAGPVMQAYSTVIAQGAIPSAQAVLAAEGADLGAGGVALFRARSVDVADGDQFARAEAIAGDNVGTAYAQMRVQVVDEAAPATATALLEATGTVITRSVDEATASITLNGDTNNVGVIITTDNGNGVGIEVVATGAGQAITLQTANDAQILVQPLGGTTAWGTDALARLMQDLNALNARLTADVTIANAEARILALSVPANVLVGGATYRITGYAIMALTVVGGDPIWRVRIGPNTLTGNIAAAITGFRPGDNASLQIDALVTIRTAGAGGTAMGSIDQITPGAAPQITASVATVAVDTTVANLIELTGISGDAGNSFTFKNVVITRVA